LDGRAAAAEGKYKESEIAYSAAIDLNENNPATHFERALVLVALEDYEGALADLDTVLSLSKDWDTPVQREVQENSELYAAVWREKENHQALVALVPTPTNTPTASATATPTTMPIPTSIPTPTPIPTLTPFSAPSTPTIPILLTPIPVPTPTFEVVLPPITLVAPSNHSDYRGKNSQIVLQWKWDWELSQDQYFLVNAKFTGVADNRVCRENWSYFKWTKETSIAVDPWLYDVICPSSDKRTIEWTVQVGQPTNGLDKPDALLLDLPSEIRVFQWH